MSDNNIGNKDGFINDFTNSLKKYLKDTYGEGITVNTHTAYKTNSEKIALTVEFGNNSKISPTIYPEDFIEKYLQGMPMENIVQAVGDNLFKNRMAGFERPVITAEEAHKHIRLVVCNSSLNERMLCETPHYDICGGVLSAYPRWYVNDEASFRVTTEIAGSIGLTGDEVLQIGLSNVRSEAYDAIPLGRMIENMTGVALTDEMDKGMQMIVLTNKNRLQGANQILNEDALRHVYDMCGSDICLLPSSIHEWICMPINEGMHPDMLRSMVAEINESTVAPEDRLGDFILKYDGVKLTPVFGDTFDMEGIEEGLKVSGFKVKMAL